MTAKSQQSKPLTKKELCKIYKISFPTLRKWLSAVPNLNLDGKRRHIPPAELEKIKKMYGGEY